MRSTGTAGRVVELNHIAVSACLDKPVKPYFFSSFCSFRDAVDMLNALYNQVDEEVHKLVILSNKSQKQLESLLEVRTFEEQTQQVTSNFISLHIVDLRCCRLSPLPVHKCDKSIQNPLSSQIKLWFSVEGEKQLAPLESQTLSVAKIKEIRESLDLFLEESVVSTTIINLFLVVFYV